MRVALAQVTSGRDLVENLALVEEYAERASAAGAGLVVFPEATMRAFGHRLTDIAEPLDGDWAARVRDIAARHGIVIVAGMFTPGDAGRVRNTLLITGQGVEAAYDKIHLFDAFGFAESDTVAPGEGTVTFEVGELVVGAATCYDIRFPRLFDRLARDGAQAIVVPASWGSGEGKAEAFQLLARARALDTTCYVLACDQADPRSQGRDPGRAPTGVGHSIIVAPDGTVLASAGAGPELLVADLDPELVARVRQTLPVLANARRT
ncbi:carbon-nitrogen hydrolase family protein [Naumannella cuiyingiana]|uniref:Putative amidohydrolase n=1 Tax=Naumannella cuiyingiana TaxID=1347891 RepID=A0A7Z0IM79_9ACTN|nr:carbon-nitrogen hydrolase family protein [Naumannella cuiyingiana]NYI72336.1 putative amidohydrolase [Naumannella cuiyingiana]